MSRHYNNSHGLPLFRQQVNNIHGRRGQGEALDDIGHRRRKMILSMGALLQLNCPYILRERGLLSAGRIPPVRASFYIKHLHPFTLLLTLLKHHMIFQQRYWQGDRSIHPTIMLPTLTLGLYVYAPFCYFRKKSQVLAVSS